MAPDLNTRWRQMSVGWRYAYAGAVGLGSWLALGQLWPWLYRPLLYAYLAVMFVKTMIFGPQWLRLWFLTIVGAIAFVGLFALLLAATAGTAP